MRAQIIFDSLAVNIWWSCAHTMTMQFQLPHANETQDSEFNKNTVHVASWCALPTTTTYQWNPTCGIWGGWNLCRSYYYLKELERLVSGSPRLRKKEKEKSFLVWLYQQILVSSIKYYVEHYILLKNARWAHMDQF